MQNPERRAIAQDWRKLKQHSNGESSGRLTDHVNEVFDVNGDDKVTPTTRSNAFQL